MKFEDVCSGLGGDGLADFVEEAFDLEGLEEDALEPFLAGADDGVVRVVAEAGHEDDGRGRGEAAGDGVDLVAVVVGHPDIAEDQIEGWNFPDDGAFEGGHGFAAGFADDGVAAVVVEDVADDSADLGFVVGDEDAFAGEDGVVGDGGEGFVDAEECLRAAGALANAAADGVDVLKDSFDVAGEFGVALGELAEDVDFALDVGEGFGDFAFDAFADLAVGEGAFDDEEAQGVEGDGDVAGEDLGELSIGFVECRGALAFDVEDADDSVVEAEGDGERGSCADETWEEEFVGGGVVADIAFSGGGDEAGDAVAFGFGADLEGVDDLWGDA